MKKKLFFTMLLLLMGVSMQAQSIATEQMDERFNDNKLPYGWFTEGWKVDSTGVAKKGSPDKAENDSTSTGMPEFDISSLMGGGSSLNYLMTPPLNVQSGESLVFSARKGKDSGMGSFMGGDSDSTFVVERAVYGEHMWIKVADFTTELDSVFKTFTISNTAPGEYRFRFRAAGNVEIDSVAGYHIDNKAPDIYPMYLDKNIQPIDLSLCKQDTTVTISIINTATDTLTVDLSTSDGKAFSLDTKQVIVAAADTAKVKLTFTFSQGHEGRNSTMLKFKTTDSRVEEIQLPIDAIISQSDVWTEDFNNKVPEGWFTEGWKVDSTGVATLKQGGDDGMGMFGGSSTVYYLMTPPLTVSDVNDVLLFSAMKPGGGGGMDFSSMMGGGGSSSPSFFIEKSVYGSGKWEMAKDFSNALDTVYTTHWLSGLEPGEYRFRFMASDSISIDSVAGFKIDMNAPDLYVTLDSAAVSLVNYGMLRGNTTKTFTVMNTGTGTLGVNVASLDATRLTFNEKNLSIATGDSLLLDATMLRDDERQGEVNELMMFTPTDNRVSPQAIALSAYIIRSDAWSEDFEPTYVIEDQTYPRRFPEGWSSTGWTITQDSSNDMMAMFGGGSGEEPSWVLKTDSKEYEVITPRLQAKKGNLLRFTANIGGGGMMAMMSMFMGGGGTPSYLNLYYKRDADKDWTLYNTYFQSDTIVFKAPYSGFYRLKFMGNGASLDDFYGFSLPKDSIEIPEVVSGFDFTSLLQEVDGQTWNVVYDRRIAARDNGDGTFSPVAATVCLPYEFNIDDYYAPGKAKIYQMEYVDTIYSQLIFRELPDNLMEAGKPYMIIVNQGELQFNAIDATMTSKVAEGTPIYDFTTWYYNFEKAEVGTWNGPFDTVKTTGQEYALRDDGLWERFMGLWGIPPFRSFIRGNGDWWWFEFKQNPDTYKPQNATDQAGRLVTRFLSHNTDGNGEVTDIPGLYYLGDINGSETNGIVAPTIHTIDRDGTHNYYDLQGHRLNGKPNKGIYIQNGKKHVAR